MRENESRLWRLRGSEYQRTKKELEEAVGSIFPDDPPLVESGKGKQAEKDFKAWPKRLQERQDKSLLVWFVK